MAASGSNSTVDLLDTFSRILKEERVFDRSNNQAVVQFVQPEDLQVNCNFFTLLIFLRISFNMLKISMFLFFN